jgi:hypothetical protein
MNHGAKNISLVVRFAFALPAFLLSASLIPAAFAQGQTSPPVRKDSDVMLQLYKRMRRSIPEIVAGLWWM